MGTTVQADSSEDAGAPAQEHVDLDLASVTFDQADIDRALDDVNISTELTNEMQRALASRVLIVASLAVSARDDADFNSSLARFDLGSPPPSEYEELVFVSEFARGLVGHMLEDAPATERPYVQMIEQRLSALGVIEPGEILGYRNVDPRYREAAAV